MRERFSKDDIACNTTSTYYYSRLENCENCFDIFQDGQTDFEFFYQS